MLLRDIRLQLVGGEMRKIIPIIGAPILFLILAAPSGGPEVPGPSTLATYTVGTLPTCGAAQKGQLIYISDGQALTPGGSISGSGSGVVGVCNGSGAAWIAG